jgi:flagellar protein FlgJ
MEHLIPLAHPLELTRAGTEPAAERLVQQFTRAGGLQTGSLPELQKAAKEFEGYLISYLLKVMRETVPTGWLDSEAQHVFLSFYDQEIGRLAAERGGLGLGAMFLEHYGAPAAQNPSSSGSSLPIPEPSR